MRYPKEIISTKPNFIEGLKSFTGLVTGKRLDVDILKKVIKKYDFDNTIIKRLLTYILNNPKLVIYFDKYLNDLYANYDLIEFIKSYRLILQDNDYLDSRKFMYFKATDNHETLQFQIIDLLDQYFQDVYQEDFNYYEMIFYYHLFQNKIITEQDIYDIEELLTQDHKIKFNEVAEVKIKASKTVDEILNNIKSKSNTVKNLSENILLGRKLANCTSCKFFNNPIVPLDGNIDEPTKIDLIILNLFPSFDDSKSKKIFSDPKNIFRIGINQLPGNVKWLLMNIMPCAFKSKSEIGKVKELEGQVNTCYNLVFKDVLNKLQYKYCILIGEEVSKKFLPDVDFKKQLGELIQDKYILLPSPKNVKTPSALVKFKEMWENVVKLLIDNNEVKSEPEVIKTDIPPAESANEIEEKPDKSWTLLDIRELKSDSGKYSLMIYIDDLGMKHYIKKKNVQTGYISNKTFKECSVFSSDMDYSFNMNNFEKRELVKLLQEKLEELK